MSSYNTPLEIMLKGKDSFLIHDNRLYLFRDIHLDTKNDESSDLPYIVNNGVRINGSKPQDYVEIEKEFITSGSYSEKLQKKFLQDSFANNFYSSSDENKLESMHKISQYVLSEAIPALLVSYADEIGVKLPDKDSFLRAQDLVFDKIGGFEQIKEIEKDFTLDELKNVFTKDVAKLLHNSRLINLGHDDSVLSFYTNNASYFGFDGELYRLDEEIDSGVQISISDKSFGLKRIKKNEYYGFYPERDASQLQIFDDSKLLKDYGSVLEKYILARTIDDQEEYIEDLLPRLRLGDRYKVFKKDSKIEFGNSDVGIGAYWLESNYEYDLGQKAMVVYMKTPLTFIRGVKIRKNEFDHLSSEFDLDKNEPLYWKFPENKVCVFVSCTYNGDIKIGDSAIVENVKHTGIAGEIACRDDDLKGQKYKLMCGVENGYKRKPLGQDAVDILGVALNYYQNGISPKAVLDHSGGSGFLNSYDVCFPLGEGYPEEIVNSIIMDAENNGRVVWKANHMHLILDEHIEKRGSR